MADQPDARAYLASRHLFVQKAQEDGTSKYIACSDPAFVPALKACVEEFNQAIQVKTILIRRFIVHCFIDSMCSTGFTYCGDA